MSIFPRNNYVQINNGAMDCLPASYLTQREADRQENSHFPRCGRFVTEAYEQFYTSIEESRRINGNFKPF